MTTLMVMMTMMMVEDVPWTTQQTTTTNKHRFSSTPQCQNLLYSATYTFSCSQNPDSAYNILHNYTPPHQLNQRKFLNSKLPHELPPPTPLEMYVSISPPITSKSQISTHLTRSPYIKPHQSLSTEETTHFASA